MGETGRISKNIEIPLDKQTIVCYTTPMKTNTKESILREAGALFARNGYNGVSVRMIARAVGINEGSIYNHFASKEEILEEILDRHAQELDSIMPKSEAMIAAYDRGEWRPAWANRAKALEAAGANSDQSIILILMNEQYRLPQAREIVRKYYMEIPVQVTCDLLKHIEAAGTPLPADAMTLARAYQYPIFTMTQEYEMSLAAGEDPVPALRKIEAHVEFFWKDIMKLQYK